MIHVAICDDSRTAAGKMEALVYKILENECMIEAYNNSTKLYTALDNYEYDIYFLDIDMPEIDGIQLAEKIREKNEFSVIVFLTNYREYMENVFKVRPFDYMIKSDINEERVEIVLSKAIHFLGGCPNKFTYTFNKTNHSIPINDIFYFQKSGKETIIHSLEGEDAFYLDTPTLLDKAGNNFVQVNKFYIVNIHYICEFNKNSLIVEDLTDSVQISIGRKYKENCLSQIISVLGGEC